jgi:hypothetical protein
MSKNGARRKRFLSPKRSLGGSSKSGLDAFGTILKKRLNILIIKKLQKIFEKTIFNVMARLYPVQWGETIGNSFECGG